MNQYAIITRPSLFNSPNTSPETILASYNRIEQFFNRNYITNWDRTRLQVHLKAAE